MHYEDLTEERIAELVAEAERGYDLNRLVDCSNHVRLDKGHERPCQTCGSPTRWVELFFSDTICPGQCTDAAYQRRLSQ